MKLTSISFAAGALLLASNLQAETVIKRYAGPLPERPAITHVAPSSASVSGSLAKTENPTTFYILPFFKIDSTDAGGETTFLSIRNESAGVEVVDIEIFDPANLNDPETLTNALLPKETWVLNLRNETSLPADGDGFVRGWARLLSDGPISADFFQFNPSQDFATGGMPVDIDAGEFCQTVKTRFLIGGTFDGGTLLTFMQDLALGGDPGTDPPSITGTVYLEDASMAGTFEIYTDRLSLEVNAADLVAPGVNFGSIDIEFQNPFTGGFAFVEYKANNRFSVGTKSVCLD